MITLSFIAIVLLGTLLLFALSKLLESIFNAVAVFKYRKNPDGVHISSPGFCINGKSKKIEGGSKIKTPF
ncbi:MAG: hypothetical protein J6K16_07920 [Alphaproteobacteria bacterium]|nr:hypothetical protein [Alphaproteobacteria bacterium]